MSGCRPMILLTKFLGIWPEAIVTDMLRTFTWKLSAKNWDRIFKLNTSELFDYSIWQGSIALQGGHWKMETFFVRSQLP